MIKLLIFDLDGTLLNTLEDLADSVNHALREFHYEEKDLEYVRKAIGNGVRVLVSRCLPDGFDNKDYNDILNSFREYYKKNYVVHTKEYGNMSKSLQILSKHYQLAVVTNKLDYIAKDLIDFFFYGLFSYVQGDVDYLNKKPHPDMVNHVLETLKVDRKEAFYIGDTNVDYETAKNAGVKVLLVTYGYRTKKELREYNFPCDTVDSPSEICRYFKK